MNKSFFKALIFVSTIYCITGFDRNAFKQQLRATVASHYKNSISILANDVLKPLADAPVPDETSVNPLAINFKNGVVRFSDQMKVAQTNSDALRQQLDRQIETVVAQHSAKERELQGNEQQLQSVNAQIHGTNAQIADAQGQVQRAQNDLANAENSVRHEEDRVEKSRNCITRGKRGIWKKIKNAVKKVVNAPCHVLNHGGINNAKNGRERAKQHRDQMINRLNSLNNAKNQLVASRAQLEQNRNQILTQKQHLQNEISVLQAARNNAIAFNAKLKSVVLHLTTLQGKSHVLKDTALKLIDMETVLNPLNAIADQINSYTGIVEDVNFVNAMKSSIVNSVNVLRQKLPQYPFVLINL